MENKIIISEFNHYDEPTNKMMVKDQEDFNDDFQIKFNNNMISMKDLDSLTSRQLEELKKKEIYNHLKKKITSSILYQIIGIDKLLELYRYDENDFVVIMDLMYTLKYYQKETILLQKFEKRLQSAEVFEIKDICYDFIKENILTGKPIIVYCNNYPAKFLHENQGLFLQHDNLPDEVQDRYFKRHLTIKDYVEYPVFQKIPIDSFMSSNDYFIKFVHEHYGFSKFQELVDRHYDVISYLAKNDQMNKFCNYLKEMDNLEENFYQAVKTYYLKNIANQENFHLEKDDAGQYILPEWLHSMNFMVLDKIHSIEDLMNYQMNTLLLDEEQFSTIENMSIKNMRRAQQELSFFSRKNDKDGLPMFDLFNSYLHNSLARDINFKNGLLPYQDYLLELKKCIHNMEQEDYFKDLSFITHSDFFQYITMFTKEEDSLSYVSNNAISI